MKRKLMFLALAAIGLASCNGGFKQGPGGMLYKIVDDKSGPSIQTGDYICINYIIKNDADSVLQSSYENGQPASVTSMPKPQMKGDVLSGLSYLSEGDSAIIKTNIDSLSKGHPRSPGMKGKYMVYVIKVLKVIQKGNLSPQVFQGRVQAYMNTLMDGLKKQEPINIKKYIADNNLKVTQTASGLNYVITKTGTGIKPVAGDTVSVYYLGRFTDGKVFDTNIKAEAMKAKLQINPMNPYKPIRFPLGVRNMIAGWNEGLQLLSVGSKATFVIPSGLAYGPNGYQAVGPYTPLVFDVELVDVTHPNPNAPKPVAPPMPGSTPSQQPQAKK
jgi:FKBP-type peptidyl-prolyl cis-trans isomerase FkpA